MTLAFIPRITQSTSPLFWKLEREPGRSEVGIPNIGAAIATIPAVLAALASQGPGTAALVALGYLLINLLVGNVLEPRVLGRTLGLSPLAVLLGMLFWGWLWGPSGALLSVPLIDGREDHAGERGGALVGRARHGARPGGARGGRCRGGRAALALRGGAELAAAAERRGGAEIRVAPRGGAL